MFAGSASLEQMHERAAAAEAELERREAKARSDFKNAFGVAVGDDSDGLPKGMQVIK